MKDKPIDGQVALDLGDVSAPPPIGVGSTSSVRLGRRKPTLVIEYVRRVAESGEVDRLEFTAGVNLLVGPPNTGKSKWIRFIDYLLGDSDPPETTLTPELAAKYRTADLALRVFDSPADTSDAIDVDDQSAIDGNATPSHVEHAQADGELAAEPSRVLHIERRWKEPGMRSKVVVDGNPMPAEEFSQFLVHTLGIPTVHYPRGDPYAPRAWAMLSWRSLFRHMYREERFWTDLADKQFEAEQHASLMQFLGLAEALFSQEYGELVSKRREIQQLHVEKASFMAMLHRVTTELDRFAELSVSVTPESLEAARKRLAGEQDELNGRRLNLLHDLADAAASEHEVGRVQRRALTEQHGAALTSARFERERLEDQLARTNSRLNELSEHRDAVQREREKLERAVVAGNALSELRVTHCPVCDQTVRQNRATIHECYLCLQPYEQTEAAGMTGSHRVAFETEQLRVEADELNEVINKHEHARDEIVQFIAAQNTVIHDTEALLRPTQVKAAAILPPDLSVIDQAIGGIVERLRTLDGVARALEQRDTLTSQIEVLEARAGALESEVETKSRAVRFETASTLMADGFNTYFNALNAGGLEHWPEGDVSVRFGKRDFRIAINGAEWRTKLGATLGCFFLFAYHYALLSLSGRPECNYPGLSVIDLPPTLADDHELTDEENYLVEPFIALLDRMLPTRAQLIIAGRAFVDLAGANRIPLTHVWH